MLTKNLLDDGRTTIMILALLKALKEFELVWKFIGKSFKNTDLA